MAGGWRWGVHAHPRRARRVSLAGLLCSLSLYQQDDGGGGCGKQRYGLIMPGFCHVYPIDLEQPANSASDRHLSTNKHPETHADALPLSKSASQSAVWFRTLLPALQMDPGNFPFLAEHNPLCRQLTHPSHLPCTLPSSSSTSDAPKNAKDQW